MTLRPRSTRRWSVVTQLLYPVAYIPVAPDVFLVIVTRAFEPVGVQGTVIVEVRTAPATVAVTATAWLLHMMLVVATAALNPHIVTNANIVEIINACAGLLTALGTIIMGLGAQRARVS